MNVSMKKNTAIFGSLSIAALSLVVGYGAMAIASPNSTTQKSTANVTSLDRISSIKSTSSLPKMAGSDDSIVKRMLPERPTVNSGTLIQDDFVPNRGRILLSTAQDQSLSLTRLGSGQVCFVTHLSKDSTDAGCVHELENGDVSPLGAWTAAGQVLYGIVGDKVHRVQIRTNTGATSEATLENNAYWWDSQSSDRKVFGVALILTNIDGTSNTVLLPDEGTIATRG